MLRSIARSGYSTVLTCEARFDLVVLRKECYRLRRRSPPYILHENIFEFRLNLYININDVRHDIMVMDSRSRAIQTARAVLSHALCASSTSYTANMYHRKEDMLEDTETGRKQAVCGLTLSTI